MIRRTPLTHLLFCCMGWAYYYGYNLFSLSLTMVFEDGVESHNSTLKNNQHSPPPFEPSHHKEETKTPPPASLPPSLARTKSKNIETELGHWAALRNKSSVDYYTCCGLGHRMSKLVDAHYVSKQKNFGLRAHWGYCDKTEVFHYLFGRQPQEELENVTSTGLRLIIANDAPGFKKMIRDQSPEHCQQKCQNSVEVEHAAYYEKLRNRFRQKDEVDTFREMYFSNYTVIGMHVRAGNGEKGDFAKKHRGINDTVAWTQSVSETLTRMVNTWDSTATTIAKPPLLFIATDTPSIIVGFREVLAGKMPVLDYQQSRVTEGTGVVFGQWSAHTQDMRGGQKCLEDWDNVVMDMMLLSHADVIVSGRPSSFTQSLPMSIALARTKSDRTISQTYCELNRSGNSSHCYEDFMEWCCEGRSDFHLEGMATRYEYRRMPVHAATEKFKIVPRPEVKQGEHPGIPCRVKNNCVLPYDWDEIYNT